MASNTIRLLSVFLLLLPLIGASNSLNFPEERVDLKYELPAVRDNSGLDTSALKLIIYLTLVNTLLLIFNRLIENHD